MVEVRHSDSLFGNTCRWNLKIFVFLEIVSSFFYFLSWVTWREQRLRPPIPLKKAWTIIVIKIWEEHHNKYGGNWPNFPYTYFNRSPIYKIQNIFRPVGLLGKYCGIFSGVLSRAIHWVCFHSWIEAWVLENHWHRSEWSNLNRNALIYQDKSSPINSPLCTMNTCFNVLEIP